MPRLLDPEFRGRVMAAVARSAGGGFDLPECLNRFGLLATPEHDQEVKVLILAELRMRLRRLKLNGLTREDVAEAMVAEVDILVKELAIPR